MKFRWRHGGHTDLPADLGPSPEERKRLDDNEVMIHKAAAEVARKTPEVERLVTRLGREIQDNHLADRLRRAFSN